MLLPVKTLNPFAMLAKYGLDTSSPDPPYESSPFVVAPATHDPKPVNTDLETEADAHTNDVVSFCCADVMAAYEDVDLAEEYVASATRAADAAAAILSQYHGSHPAVRPRFD